MQKEMAFYQPTALVVVPRLLEFILNNIKMTAKKTHKEKMMARAVKLSKFLMASHIDVRRKIFKSIHAKFGGKVRMIACGGAELDQRVFDELDDLGFNIYQGYGLTESSPILAIRGMFVKNKIGVGRALPGVELTIKEPDSQGVGEIIAKAPQVMLGYYGDKKATKEALKNGWLHTGDLGKIHEDGNLEIIGRRKNIIVASNGKNVYPEELETLINYSDIVKESLVSGIRKGLNTQIVATIVPNEKLLREKKLDTMIDVLIKNINAELPSYKHINKYIIKTEEFKKTTTLKIKRGQR
jgi:long-chain acyl-CoA synthetase